MSEKNLNTQVLQADLLFLAKQRQAFLCNYLVATVVGKKIRWEIRERLPERGKPCPDQYRCATTREGWTLTLRLKETVQEGFVTKSIYLGFYIFKTYIYIYLYICWKGGELQINTGIYKIQRTGNLGSASSDGTARSGTSQGITHSREQTHSRLRFAAKLASRVLKFWFYRLRSVVTSFLLQATWIYWKIKS